MGAFRKVVFTFFTIAIFVALTLPYLYSALFGRVNDYDLPTCIVPQHYDLTMRFFVPTTNDIDPFTFKGKAEIAIVPSVATNKIILNSKNLKYTISEIWPRNIPANKQLLQLYRSSEETEKVEFIAASPLTANVSYILRFVYTGRVGNNSKGVFLGAYKDEFNQESYFIATELQPHHARSIFPSFDTPSLKATFALTLLHKPTLQAISNTRKLKTISYGSYVANVFAITPKMSTYLLAFLIADFKQQIHGNLTVVFRSGSTNQTTHYAGTAQLLLNTLSGYLGIEYYKIGVTKMHIAVIPHNVSDGMENWGLINIREDYAFHNHNTTALKTQQYSVALLAHEISHMWFGNLVTCASWNYAWLHEGFGRYFEYHTLTMIPNYHTFQMDQQFVVDIIQSAMREDSKYTAKPLNKQSNNAPSQLAQMFSVLTYRKGAAILYMIHHIIGAEGFQKALNRYLNNFAYKTATPQDLLTCFMHYWPSNIIAYAQGLFTSYTDQPGYPLVHIECNENHERCNAKQKRFLLDRNSEANAKLQYTIPFTYATDKHKNFTFTSPQLFLTPNVPLHITLGRSVSWIIVNTQVAYYRVNYDPQNWLSLRRALLTRNWDGIPETIRAQLVDDLFNLAQAREIDYAFALHVLEYLATETHYLPWVAAFRGYDWLAKWQGSNAESFANCIRQLTRKAFERYGFEERSTDSVLERYTRKRILTWSCRYGNAECISEAQSYYRTHKIAMLSADIRAVVQCVIVRNGNANDFENINEMFKNSGDINEKQLLLEALSCTKRATLVKKYFWIVLNADLQQQYKKKALVNLCVGNSESVVPIFKLVTENLNEVVKSLGGYRIVAILLHEISTYFWTHNQKLLLKQFNRNAKGLFGDEAKYLVLAEENLNNELNSVPDKIMSSQRYFRNFNLSYDRTLT